MIAVGVDGCRSGWVVATTVRRGGALPHAVRIDVVSGFAEVIAMTADAQCVAVDMPIGLLDLPRTGGRDCDRAARALLGRQGSSVFSPPARPALAAREYREAQRLQGAGLSIQTWNIVPRIRDVDGAMTPSLQARILEARPCRQGIRRGIRSAGAAARRGHRPRHARSAVGACADRREDVRAG
jgi:predicted RNase H-like nuclease